MSVSLPILGSSDHLRLHLGTQLRLRQMTALLGFLERDWLVQRTGDLAQVCRCSWALRLVRTCSIKRVLGLENWKKLFSKIVRLAAQSLRRLSNLHTGFMVGKWAKCDTNSVCLRKTMVRLPNKLALAHLHKPKLKNRDSPVLDNLPLKEIEFQCPCVLE